MRVLRQVLTALKAIALSAAMVSASSAAETTGPGDEGLDLKGASQLFIAICVQTYPNFPKAMTVVAEKGFRASPRTGTFYDGERDVSLELVGDIDRTRL